MKSKQSVEQRGQTEIVDTSKSAEDSDQDRSNLQQPREIIMRCESRSTREHQNNGQKQSNASFAAELIPAGQPFLTYWRPMTKRSANDHNLL